MGYIENSNLDRIEKRLNRQRQEDYDDYFDSEESFLSIKVTILVLLFATGKFSVTTVLAWKLE